MSPCWLMFRGGGESKGWNCSNCVWPLVITMVAWITVDFGYYTSRYVFSMLTPKHNIRWAIFKDRTYSERWSDFCFSFLVVILSCLLCFCFLKSCCFPESGYFLCCLMLFSLLFLMRFDSFFYPCPDVSSMSTPKGDIWDFLFYFLESVYFPKSGCFLSYLEQFSLLSPMRFVSFFYICPDVSSMSTPKVNMWNFCFCFPESIYFLSYLELFSLSFPCKLSEFSFFTYRHLSSMSTPNKVQKDDIYDVQRKHSHVRQQYHVWLYLDPTIVECPVYHEDMSSIYIKPTELVMESRRGYLPSIMADDYMFMRHLEDYKLHSSPIGSHPLSFHALLPAQEVEFPGKDPPGEFTQRTA
jgi:hypothetical protein